MPIDPELSSGSISLWRIKGLPTCHLHFELRLETKDGVVVAVTITVIYQRQFIACAIGVVVYVFLHPDLQFLQHFFNLRNLNIVSNDIVTGRLVAIVDIPKRQYCTYLLDYLKVPI
jgi:hypothetical protein